MIEIKKEICKHCNGTRYKTYYRNESEYEDSCDYCNKKGFKLIAYENDIKLGEVVFK